MPRSRHSEDDRTPGLIFQYSRRICSLCRVCRRCEVQCSAGGRAWQLAIVFEVRLQLVVEPVAWSVHFNYCQLTWQVHARTIALRDSSATWKCGTGRGWADATKREHHLKCTTPAESFREVRLQQGAFGEKILEPLPKISTTPQDQPTNQHFLHFCQR